jgi:hypothetical protein
MSDENMQINFCVTLEDMLRVSPQEAISAEIGNVFLVRSSNVPQLGDHYIIIKGGLVQKPHGLRPETLEYPVIGPSPIAEVHEQAPVIVWRLNDASTQRFYAFYDVPKQYQKKSS